jgi:predicted HAD superfamily Cof-like phosphohydrolase
MTDIASITLWHKRARPQPTDKDFNTQLGCHIEEFLEMLEAVPGVDQVTMNAMSQLKLAAHRMADGLKSGRYSVWDRDRTGLCDAMADQIVTAVGVMYCAKMDAEKATAIVNTSNWSKFDENGQPIRDDNGKIKKGPNYVPPHLDECV